MSTIFHQVYPEDFGAGSGLVWLDDLYNNQTEAQAAYPHVTFSYLYSGMTRFGNVSDYSMITISGPTQWFWDSYSGMYSDYCYWLPLTARATSGISYEAKTATTTSTVDDTTNLRVAYEGSYFTILPNGSTYNTSSTAEIIYVYDGDDSSYSTISGVSSYTYGGSTAAFVYYSGEWAVHDNTDAVPINNGVGTLFVTEGLDTTDMYVMEAQHTYSGAVTEAYKTWTTDAAAIMECYGRMSQYHYDPPSSSNGYSGIYWQSPALFAPPKLTINPGHYFIPHGKIWFHAPVHLDARGVRFSADFTPREDYGISPTFRSPTGREAKALITLGYNNHIFGVERDTASFNIFLPMLKPYDPGSSTPAQDLTGAALRILHFYGSQVHNINCAGPVRYGVIFSPEGEGASFNDFTLNKLHGCLVYWKWRLRGNYSKNWGESINEEPQAAWMNDTIIREGQMIVDSLSTYKNSDWSPYVGPVTAFDALNDATNPNRHPAEDIFYQQPPATSVGSKTHQFDYPSGGVWFENVSPEMVGNCHLIVASGWTNMRFEKGRYEGQNSVWSYAASGVQFGQKSIIRGQVSGNYIRNPLYGANITGIPEHLIGSGIMVETFDTGIGGMSQKGIYGNSFRVDGDENEVRWGNYRSMRSMSGDLLMQGGHSRLLMETNDGEQLKEIYVDDVYDNGNRFGVVKVRTQPKAWIKWKVATDTGPFHNEHLTVPAGTEISYRFGDFSALPDNYYVRPYITHYKLDGGLAVRLGDFYYNDDSRIYKNRYAEISEVHTATGLITPSIWIKGSSAKKYEYLDEVQHGGRIEVIGL